MAYVLGVPVNKDFGFNIVLPLRHTFKLKRPMRNPFYLLGLHNWNSFHTLTMRVSVTRILHCLSCVYVYPNLTFLALRSKSINVNIAGSQCLRLPISFPLITHHEYGCRDVIASSYGEDSSAMRSRILRVRWSKTAVVRLSTPYYEDWHRVDWTAFQDFKSFIKG